MMQYIIAHFRDEVGIIIGVIAKWGGSTLEGVEIGSKELGHNRVLQKFLEESSNKEFGASSKAFSIKTSIHLMTKLKFEKKNMKLLGPPLYTKIQVLGNLHTSLLETCKSTTMIDLRLFYRRRTISIMQGNYQELMCL